MPPALCQLSPLGAVGSLSGSRIYHRRLNAKIIYVHVARSEGAIDGQVFSQTTSVSRPKGGRGDFWCLPSPPPSPPPSHPLSGISGLSVSSHFSTSPLLFFCNERLLISTRPRQSQFCTLFCLVDSKKRSFLTFFVFWFVFWNASGHLCFRFFFFSLRKEKGDLLQGLINWLIRWQDRVIDWLSWLIKRLMNNRPTDRPTDTIEMIGGADV